RNAHLVLAAQIDLAVPVDVLRREADHRVGLDELDSDLRVVEERGVLLRQVGLELCGDVLSQPLFDPLDVDVHAELEEAERRDPLGNDALWQPESVGPETLVAERLVPLHLPPPPRGPERRRAGGPAAARPRRLDRTPHGRGARGTVQDAPPSSGTLLRERWRPGRPRAASRHVA